MIRERREEASADGGLMFPGVRAAGTDYEIELDVEEKLMPKLRIEKMRRSELRNYDMKM